MNKNQKSETLTLSIIIPVYNEENYLSACLDSIARQTVKPLEVIVIDNNSTDSSMRIARRYPFVRILRERRQHQAFAQHTGFTAAGGDIIGRIDADTILPQDWVENVRQAFETDKEVLAITGSGEPYDLALSKPGKFVLDQFYLVAAHLAGHMMLWGSNCAFRRDVWPQISEDLNLRADIWEDYDLAFAIGRHGKIAKVDNIDVKTSFRAVRKPIHFQVRYQIRSVRTFALRRRLLRTGIFALAWSTLVLSIPIVLLDKYLLKLFKLSGLDRTRKIYTKHNSTP